MAKTKAQNVVVKKEIKEVVFHFLEGENEGVEIRVNPPRELIVGRSEECDIFLGEKKISRKHSKILVSSKSIQLVDLQSTNGTFLNSKKISETEVRNEDKIRYGSSVIQVMITTEASLGTDSARPIKQEPEIKNQPSQIDEEPPTGQLEPSLSSHLNFDDEHPDPSQVVDIPSSDEPFEEHKPEVVAEPEIEEEEDLPPLPEPDFSQKSKTLSGNLSAMGLADLLQNLAQNQKSGLLILRGLKEGKIWIVSGRVVHAELGQVSGPKAVYRMLAWNEGVFEMAPLPDTFDDQSVENPIVDSVEALLMEGFRQFDELEKVKKGLPAFTSRLRLKPKFAAPLSKLHPRVLDVLQMILNEEKFDRVLDQSPLSDLETAKVVFYLIKKDYVVAE